MQRACGAILVCAACQLDYTFKMRSYTVPSIGMLAAAGNELVKLATSAFQQTPSF